MALPKGLKWVTTDCYGTLIDWEKGIVEAFQEQADRDGFTFDPAELLAHFHPIQREIQAGSYELYAEVLRRSAVRAARELGWELESSRAQFMPDSVAGWPPFRETNAALERLARKYSIGILSNTDDKLLGQTRRHLRVDLDLVVTAQQVRSYKPDPAHFRECARRLGSRRGWVHIGASYELDVEPLFRMRVPVIWVNRKGEDLDGRRKPPEEVKNFREAAKLLGC